MSLRSELINVSVTVASPSFMDVQNFGVLDAGLGRLRNSTVDVRNLSVGYSSTAPAAHGILISAWTVERTIISIYNTYVQTLLPCIPKLIVFHYAATIVRDSVVTIRGLCLTDTQRLNASDDRVTCTMVMENSTLDVDLVCARRLATVPSITTTYDVQAQLTGNMTGGNATKS